MKTDRELLQMALEAMTGCSGYDLERRKNAAITAIKERFAQPEQEPVAWAVFIGNIVPS